MRYLLFYICLLSTFDTYSQSNCVNILTTSLQDAACNSPTSYTGSVTITVLNGSANYTYEWQDSNANPLFPPQTSSTANNLPPGDYIVEVTDLDNNCVETELISIGYVGLIDASITLSDFTYNPVFYNQWTFDTVKIYNYGCETRVRPEFRVSHPSGNVTTNDFSVDYYDALIGQWLPIVIQNDNGEVVGYYGDPTGVELNQPLMSQVVRVKFHPSADIGLYTSENDLWEVDVNGNHIQKLDSLEFVTLELMDACPSFSSTANILDASCYGFNNGSIDLEVSGGSLPYSYQWSHGPQSQDVNALLADTYTVVIQDAGICVLFDTLIVQQYPSGVPDNRYSDNVTASSVDLFFMPSTQVDQYRFRYRPLNSSAWQVVGIGGLNTVPELDSLKSLNNLNSNTTYEWQMKVWSLNSCVDGWSSSKYFTTLCVDVDIDTISLTCHDAVDGQISLQLSGDGLYSTTWSSQQSGNIISNLTAGLFVFTVLDTSGCSYTDSVFLNNPPMISTSFSNTNVSCYGGNDGVSQVTITDGTLPYSYLWSNGSTQNFANGLTNGYVYVEVSDSNNCSVLDSVYIQQPQEISLSETISTPSCNAFLDASISVVVSGGTPSYNFTWSNGDSTIFVDSLSAGLYWLQIVDANNCIFLDTFLLSEPNELVITEDFTEHQDVLCFGFSSGEISLLASGGTSSYSFSIDNVNFQSSSSFDSLTAGEYWFYVHDANNCQDSLQLTITQPASPLSTQEIINLHQDVLCSSDSSGVMAIMAIGGTPDYMYSLDQVNWQDQSVFNDLPADFYTVFVIDSNLCSDQISIEITEPQILTGNLFATQVSCFGFSDASVSSSIQGGVVPYSFVWNDSSTADNLSNVAGGLYSLTVLDSNNCIFVDSIQVIEPTEIQISSTTIDVSCYNNMDGFVMLNVSGGTPSYLYSLDAGPYQSSAVYNNLDTGIHEFNVLDANNCQNSVSVVIEQPDSIFFSNINIVDVQCFGDTNGSVSVQAFGGLLPYLYSIDFGGQQSTGTFSNLAAEQYILSVTDSNGCLFEDTLIIGQPDSMSVSMSLVNISCYGINDGELTANVLSGGSSTYQYSLGIGGFSPIGTFTGLSAGTDSLFVQDSLGCTQSYVFEVLQPDSLAISVVAQEPSCFESCDGFVEASVFGGNSYTLFWSNFVSGFLNDSLCDGLINLTVTDSLGCSNYYSFDLQQPPPVYPIITHSEGFLQTDSTFLTYQWIDSNGFITGETDFHYSPSLSGLYWVEVSDSSGCLGVSLAYDFLFSSVAEHHQGWKVYPIPAINNLFLESDSDIFWRIFDTHGKLLNKGVCSSYTEIDISHLRQGVYVVQVLKENRTFFKKIIKQ